jgi:hypothetical protein
LADIRVSRLSVDRYARVIERFAEYKKSAGLTDFGITHWFGNAHNFSNYELARLFEVGRMVGTSNPYEFVLLGGVFHRTRPAMKAWLLSRQNMGVKTLITSFLGYGDVHDKWNRKKGNFDFLMESQQLATEIGMGLIQRTFLISSTLPMVGRLLDRLDEIGGNVVERVAYLLFYSGLARKYDDQRVTMEILDNQPTRVKGIYREDKSKWKSEKDWIEYARNEQHDPYENSYVVLKLDDANIDKVESMSCEAIITDLTQRTKAAYASVPSREELCEKYGDKTNEKVYMFMWDMECKWMDRYLRDNPVVFERYLTHFGR